MADDEDILEQEDTGDPSVVLMLSLYLIILAFFILLNAISEMSQERFEAASESVAQGFSFSASPGEQRQEQDVDMTIEQVFSSISDEIKAVLDAYLTLQEFEFQQNDQKMRINLKTTRFFNPGELTINPEMGNFFIDLADQIARPRPGIYVDTKVMVNAAEEDLGGIDYDLMELGGRRASLFTRALIERGIFDQRIRAATRVTRQSGIELMLTIVVEDEEAALKSKQYRAQHPIESRQSEPAPDFSLPEPVFE